MIRALLLLVLGLLLVAAVGCFCLSYEVQHAHYGFTAP